jgi:murein DD-endopeptidase MepM/ murein hydrolase activator NlpD
MPKSVIKKDHKQVLRSFLTLLLISLCFSCSQKPAKVLNRSKVHYSKNNSVAKESVTEKKSQNRQVEVTSGDTVYSISKKYQTSPRELIKQNDLNAPYSLKAGTKVTIPTATYHEVQKGETMYAISRAYNMKIDDIVGMNDLKEPYYLKAGQKIKIAKGNESESATPLKTKAETKAETKIETAENQEKPKKSEAGLIEKTLDKFNHFSWPIRGTIISKFGPKKGGLYNDGINIKAKEGTVVKAAEDGMVAYVGNELKGYGNLVIIKHSSGWITAYAHLASSKVARGQKVAKGAKVGTVGSSGNVDSPQLYFGLRKGRDAVNPENYLKN